MRREETNVKGGLCKTNEGRTRLKNVSHDASVTVTCSVTTLPGVDRVDRADPINIRVFELPSAITTTSQMQLAPDA